MPVEVSRWMAKDGTLHGSRGEAAEYEGNQMVKKDLDTFVLAHFGFLTFTDRSRIVETLFKQRRTIITILQGDHN
jgi:hypothetical protein